MKLHKFSRKSGFAAVVSLLLAVLLLTGCGDSGGGGGGAPTPAPGGNTGGQADSTVDPPDANNISWKYVKNGAGTVTLVGYSSSGSAPSGAVSVPSQTSDGRSVTAIGDSAFYRTAVTSVSLPTTIKSIGKSAFSECSKLVDLSFPEGLEAIDDYAFYHSGVQKIVLPINVKRVGTAAFYNCPSLRVVTVNGTPAFAEDVNRGVFAGCKNLQTVSLNANTTKIAEGCLPNARHWKRFACRLL